MRQRAVDVAGGNERHSCRNRRRSFSRKSHAGKLERIDVNRHTEARSQDVLTRKTRSTAQRNRFPIDKKARIPERLTQLCIKRKRRRRAIDIELRIRSGVAGV